MSTNRTRASSIASSSEQSPATTPAKKIKREETGKKKGVKIGAKAKSAMKRQGSDAKVSKPSRSTPAKSRSRSRSTSPILPEFDEDTLANFPTGKPGETTLETVICKHCKRPVLKRTAKDHIQGCLKSKQEKARKKKEAREAKAKEKEKSEVKERGGGGGSGTVEEEDDDEDDVRDGSKNSKKKGANAGGGGGDDDGKKAKKRKLPADEEEKDSKSVDKKKKKKEEVKPKVAKAKGPVDVERQCGVILPNGQQCARSLTCKSHSMGAKRAVPGRSLPYDVLLQAYQKKNQARQQKAAIEANAPMLLDEELDGAYGAPVDSDEERDLIMTAVSKSISRPQPLVANTLFYTRQRYQLIRMKEMLSNALTGNRSGSLFAVPKEPAYPSINGIASMTDGFVVPPAITPSSAAPGSASKAMARKASVDVT